MAKRLLRLQGKTDHQLMTEIWKEDNKAYIVGEQPERAMRAIKSNVAEWRRTFNKRHLHTKPFVPLASVPSVLYNKWLREYNRGPNKSCSWDDYLILKLAKTGEYDDLTTFNLRNI